MDLYGKKDKSIPQKITLTIIELIIIGLSYWILFSGGYNDIFKANTTNGNLSRHIILFTFNVIVFIRICITFFYLIKRHIPWSEALNIPFAFAIYYIGYAFLGYTTSHPLDALDICAMALFVIGSFTNTASELLRDEWKKQPGHKGMLYTKGFFKYAMHINYFGDLLWVIAYAVITRNWYSIIIPLFLFSFFAFYNIPKLDKYLASKYGEQFIEYSKKTSRFIPFIY